MVAKQMSRRSCLGLVFTVLGFGSKDGINNDHLHTNPAEAGLVEKAEDYVYSSAKDYIHGGQL
jgi:hypothetical protein